MTNETTAGSSGDDAGQASGEAAPADVAAALLARYRGLMGEMQAVNEQLLLAGLREQQLAEQLQHQLAFISAVTASLREGVYALDLSGRITFVNPAAARLLGSTDAELRGRDAHAVIHLRSATGARIAPVAMAPPEGLPAGPGDHDDEAILTRWDGTMVAVAYAAAPIISAGQTLGVAVTLRDMTEVRRLQRLQEEYLALISHDLRGPLTTIILSAQMVLRTLTEQSLGRDVRRTTIILDSCQRMNQMVEGLLDRSRLESGQGALGRCPIDLVQLAAQIIDAITTAADGAPIQRTGAAALTVVGDAAEIKRVISNLLTNALKFSAPGSPILLRIEPDGDRALLTIADQGVGIGPQDLPHVFEKHYRAPTHTATAGSGLGLYISRLIIEAHGGQIWAESTPGEGSTFTFALPMAP